MAVWVPLPCLARTPCCIRSNKGEGRWAAVLFSSAAYELDIP